MTTTLNPRLRPIEIQPVEENGERYFVIQDQQQLSDDSLIVTPVGAWILQHLTGENSLDEIQSTFRDEMNDTLPDGMLEELVNALNEHYLLENERSRERMQSIQEQFRSKTVREPTMPGQSLPADAEGLKTFLDDTLPSAPDVTVAEHTSGIILPHIDFPRGKETYGKTVPHLNAIPEVDRIVILGISHYTCPVPFALTDKSFQSPFGDIPTDDAGLTALEETLPYTMDEAETAHRLEHSIEIPLLLLQYARPDLDFELIPIICSYGNESDPGDLLNDFISRLGTLADQDNTYLLAGVDFAHMGPQFGDPEPLSTSDYESIEQHDRSMIESLVEADADDFESHIQADQNRRRVCGYPALRTVLPLFDSGRLIDYEQWQDPQETVTYGSLVMQ